MGSVLRFDREYQKWSVSHSELITTCRCASTASLHARVGPISRYSEEMVPIAALPNALGHFGEFGGRYAPEILVAPLDELDATYREVKDDPRVQAELAELFQHYSGRPTPLYYARRLSEHLGGAAIYLKREDLLHTGRPQDQQLPGASVVGAPNGQAANHRRDRGWPAWSRDRQQSAALFGIECMVYMGSEDMRRQELNVFRMRLLGAEVVDVNAGSCTLKEAISEAMRDWAGSFETTHYMLGSALGPHPYPMIVRDFQRVIGVEAREQFLKASGGTLPDLLIACVGGGSNAIGLFHRFLEDAGVAMVRGGGRRLRHGSRGACGSILGGPPGRPAGHEELHPARRGRSDRPYSLGIRRLGLRGGSGPEHAWLRELGRTHYTSCSDADALAATKTLSHLEGIIPALESAHAVAEAIKRAPSAKGQTFVVNLSGRGDKDIGILRENMPELG